MDTYIIMMIILHITAGQFQYIFFISQHSTRVVDSKK